MKITKEEARQLCEFMELNMIPYIQNDKDIDNMTWLVLMVSLFKKLADYCEYEGFTYQGARKYECEEE